MKRLFTFTIVILCCQLYAQTLLWTSPNLGGAGNSGEWIVLRERPLDIRFFRFEEATSKLTIMDGPLSTNVFSEIVMEILVGGYEVYSFLKCPDYSGDGLNDILLERMYASPTSRNGFRIVDVTNGQTIYTFDDEAYSYYYYGYINPDINGDGHCELVASRSDLNDGSFHYIVYNTNGIPSSASNIFNPLPNKEYLNQNYPNPFNPSTTIEYEITEPENVKINVYDVTGRLVKELVNGQRNSGKYSTFWNGKDNYGNTVASGNYFYQIISGDYVQAKKMIYLK